jgi:hypothetical protein
MTLAALRDDALSSTPDGWVLRLSLPWIRSLPVASLEDLEVAIDGEPRSVGIAIGDRTVDSASLSEETGWWFVQDRLRLRGDDALAPGPHEVAVSFALVIPYLQAGPDGPLRLPFAFDRALPLDAPTRAGVSRDVA